MSFRLKKCPQYSRQFSEYGRDANHIFFMCGVLPDADLATFELVPAEGCPDLGGYARDSKSVWFHGKVIPGADAATFRVREYARAFDKNRQYFDGRPARQQ